MTSGPTVRRAAPLFDADPYTTPNPRDPASRFTVLNDEPIGADDGDDLLDATWAARSLADLVIASREAAPFTVAVDAEWGMGKSTLMRRLDATLSEDETVTTVWFNAWTAKGGSALEGLIKSVVLSLDRNAVRRAVRTMSRHAYLVGMLRAVSLLVMSFFGLGRVVNDIWRTLSLDAKSRNEINRVVREMLRTWIASGPAPDRRRLLVVFVDDLDRCPGEKIIEVCEAIKLYLDVPGIVFVLACDQAALWRAVRDFGGPGKSRAGIEYLEKIIQINYRIPPPSSALARNLVDGCANRSGTSKLFDDSMKRLLIERTGRNPRRIKRLINSFVLEHHLNRAWDEIGAENLLKIIIIQHFYPEFYRVLVDSREDDPIREFLDYYEFRAAARQGDRDIAQWRTLFQAKEIKPPKDEVSDDELTGYLRNLEQELPVDFPDLAADKDFVSLLQSLRGPLNSEQLRRLLRKPLSPLPTAQLVRSDPLIDQKLDDFRDMRVLWIDDDAEGNRSLINYLSERGAQVYNAVDLTSAMEMLTVIRPTVLLSDITRGDNANAGLDDLAVLRANESYLGPVIFYTGRVTPTRVERARELGAIGVTNQADTVLRWLQSVVVQNRLSPDR